MGPTCAIVETNQYTKPVTHSDTGEGVEGVTGVSTVKHSNHKANVRMLFMLAIIECVCVCLFTRSSHVCINRSTTNLNTESRHAYMCSAAAHRLVVSTESGSHESGTRVPTVSVCFTPK